MNKILTTSIFKPLNIPHVIKRFMLSSAIKRVPVQYSPIINQNYSTRIAFQLKNKAAKDLANDGTGKHIHVGKQSCTLTDCETKVCAQLCAENKIIAVEGHNTHKPPVGRIARFISDQDVNGQQKTQYFVPTNKKSEFTEEKKQEYGKDIKVNIKTQAYVKQHNDKYE